MNMVKVVASCMLAFLFGCATTKTMDEAMYNQYGNFAGAVQRCFENGHIEPKLNGEIRTAYSRLVNTWNYDAARLSAVISTAYARESGSPQYCRAVESNAHQLIARANEHRADVREAQRADNEAANRVTIQKPIYCNRIGNTTMCN